MRLPANNRLGLWIAAAVALTCLPEAQAQYYYNGYDGGYHASTAAEGYARGMAEAIRAQGAKNLLDAKASKEYEDARDKYIDNRLKATQAYWDRKKIYDKEMAEQRYAEAQVRREHRERQVLKPLSPEDYNPTTGAIDWPMICKSDKYAEYRDPLTKLFGTRAQYGELSTDDYLQAKQLIKDFRAAITADKELYPKEAVSQSLRFLLNLNRELESNFS